MGHDVNGYGEDDGAVVFCGDAVQSLEVAELGKMMMKVVMMMNDDGGDDDEDDDDDDNDDDGDNDV